jgi:hypothetical protein
MENRPLYIFDLDGTLALIDHRKYLIEDKNNQRWDEFYRACIGDDPNKPVIKLFNALISEMECSSCDHVNTSKNDFFIFSGRSDLVKAETVDWLFKYLTIAEWYLQEILKMRKHGDYTPDEALKKQWYEELSQQDKDRLVCVFDDRQKVVDMWRSIGVTCLQVAKGDF